MREYGLEPNDGHESSVDGVYGGFDHEEIKNVRQAYDLCMQSNQLLRRTNVRVTDQNKGYVAVMKRCHATAQRRLRETVFCLEEMFRDNQCLSDINLDQIKMISFLRKNPNIFKIALAIFLIISLETAILFHLIGQVWDWKKTCTNMKDAVVKIGSCFSACFTSIARGINTCKSVLTSFNNGRDN